MSYEIFIGLHSNISKLTSFKIVVGILITDDHKKCTCAMNFEYQLMGSVI